MIQYGYGVHLKRIGIHHIDQILDWRNDASIRKWCRQNDLLSARDQEVWMVKQNDDPTLQMYSIFSDSNEMIGVCGLTSLDWINQRAEFSLYIGTEFQKMGYGMKSLKTLIHHGFSAYPLNHIYGESFDENPAISLFESLGFQKEGTRRAFYFRDGRFIDAHLYSLLRCEFQNLSESWKVKSYSLRIEERRSLCPKQKEKRKNKT